MCFRVEVMLVMTVTYLGAPVNIETAFVLGKNTSRSPPPLVRGVAVVHPVILKASAEEFKSPS